MRRVFESVVVLDFISFSCVSEFVAYEVSNNLACNDREYDSDIKSHDQKHCPDATEGHHEVHESDQKFGRDWDRFTTRCGFRVEFSS